MQYLNTLTVVLAGGKKAFRILSNCQSKPAIAFGEKIRAIDFVLSNLVSSGLDRIAVLTQPNPSHLSQQSLKDELLGSFQSLLPQIQIWEPSLERTGFDLYQATANAVYQNRGFIRNENSEYILILAGDHIYRQDYRDLLRYHQEKDADLTIAITTVEPQDSQRYGMLAMDKDQQITEFVEKPEITSRTLASMGIYVFKTAFLLECLENDAQNTASHHDFGLDIIPPLIGSSRVFAYFFNGIWTDAAAIEK